MNKVSQHDPGVQKSSDNLPKSNKQEDLLNNNEKEKTSDKRQSKSDSEEPQISKDDTRRVGFETVGSNTFQNRNRLSVSGFGYCVS